MSSFVLLAVIFHFNWGFRWLPTFNALKIRGFGRPGKHSDHIYRVMFSITSRAVWGVQLLSNKMKWGALWWPRASQYGSKWRAMIVAWYFVAFDVLLICTSSILPYQKCRPKILPPPPQAPCCASSNAAWLLMPMLRVLSAITKIQNETVLDYHLWHCTFRYMKMSYCFPHRFGVLPSMLHWHWPFVIAMILSL